MKQNMLYDDGRVGMILEKRDPSRSWGGCGEDAESHDPGCTA